MEKTVLQAFKELNIPAWEYVEAEAVGMRIRAIMSHIRNAKVNTHKLPTRFQQLNGVINMVSLEVLQKTTSPKKRDEEIDMHKNLFFIFERGRRR